MRLEKIDGLITEEAVETYKTLLRFWLYSLPIFLIIVILLNFSSGLHPKHFFSLSGLIVFSFILVLIVLKLIDKRKHSPLFFIIVYGLGIAYPLITPLLVFFITTYSAPDFTLSIMNHTIPSLFLIMTMATGFSFSFRASLLAGIFSTFLFMICFFTLRHDHPEAIANKLQMVGLSYFIEISFYIIITGLLSGLIANQARKMLAKLLDSVKKNEFVTNVLGEYVSQEVKNKILDEGGLQIEGEEKEITVLFADLRNFTTISEDRTPKEIVSILNEYFDTMVETIQKNGGVIDKFIGDAIMAYFGAPIHMNNPQQKAFNAAKEMMLNINEINIKLGKRNLPILKQGIGLHHGVVVIGNIGSKTRKNYTIIGDTVNLASRLESLTKEIGKELIISDAVIKNLDIQDQNKFEIIRDINIRGKKDLISVYSYNLQ